MKNINCLICIRLQRIFAVLSFLLLFLQPAFNQNSYVLKGTIFGGRNIPVEGVAISIEKADIQPVLSDKEGVFSLEVPDGNVWLIISPLAEYKSKRIYLNNRKELAVYLSESNMKSGFDEVPVMNRTEARRDVLTSFTDINIDRIERNNFITIDQAFQAEVPGMYSVNQSGMPGQGTINFLRGITSMNTSNAPLIIIDGMPLESPGLFWSSIEGNAYNPLLSIEPSDVSKITILKDPVSTAAYGAKGSNGVILIQTLEASATQTTINVSYKSGLNLAPEKIIPQLNDEQYKLLANEILMSSPKKLADFEDDYPGLYVSEGDELYYKYFHNTRWQDLIFSNSMFTNAHLSIKGGGSVATYGLSVGYHNQGGIIKNTSYNRFNVGFVSDLNVFRWFKMNVNAILANNNSSLRESALSPQTSPVITSLFKAPIMNPYAYDDEGNKLAYLDEVDELGTSNPMATIENFIGNNKNYRFISSIRGEADITQSLKLNSLLGINFNTMKEFVFMPNKAMVDYYNGEAQSVSQATNNYLYSFYTDNYLDYTRQFGNNHKISNSSGFRMYTNRLEIDFGEGINLPDNDQYTSLQSGQNELKNINGFNDRWNWLSVYDQLAYKYLDKYLLNVSMSSDFSTRTGIEAETPIKINGYPFGLFYSIGAGWRVSEENFLKSVKEIENLLLRLSYGTTGNDDIGNYNALDYYVLSLYRETSGLIPGTIANKSLKYETVKQLNFGIDLGLKGDRTYLTADYYNKTTSDLFIYDPQHSYTGLNSRPANLGTVLNKGLEFSLFQRVVDSRNFSWDFLASITTVENKVSDLSGEELVTNFEGGQFVTREGDPINTFYGYLFDGVFATSQQAVGAGLVNAKGIPFGAGDAIYRDISGPGGSPDGVINDLDKMNLGSPVPDYFGSISNNFRYRKWSLNILFQFVSGNEIFNYTRYLNERMTDLSNQSQHVLKRWQFEGNQTDVPRSLWKDPVGNTDFSSRWIEDGSYLRLKVITFRYTIPEPFMVFKSADFFVTATNLLTFDNYLGYNPEFSYSASPMIQGIDYALMPQSRQFMFGIKLGL